MPQFQNQKKYKQMKSIITAYDVVNGGVTRAAPTDIKFDQMLLSPHLAVAERRFLPDLITKELYTAMLADRTGTTNTIFSIPGYTALWVNGLKEYIATAVLHEAIPFIAKQAVSNGIVSITPDYAQNVGTNDYRSYRDFLMGRLDVYNVTIREWICSNYADLPGFVYAGSFCDVNVCGCESSDKPKKTLGIVFK